MMGIAMTLIELYPTLKTAHVLLAAGSVALFAARGVGTLMQAQWPMQPAARRFSVGIDIALLTAGGTLWWLLSLRPDRDAWLGVKLALIVVYIVFGSLALKRARHRSGRALAFTAALACIAMAAVVARTHDPLGPWRLLQRLACG